MDETNKGAKLSKSILDMKFMKKTKEKVLKEQEDAESKEMYSSEITEDMQKNGNILFREASITFCRKLIDGHLSFGGINKDIEKIMELEYKKAVDRAEKRNEKDISDEQMAKEYATVTDTIGNKFKNSNKRRNEIRKNKRANKFQRPENQDSLI